MVFSVPTIAVGAVCEVACPSSLDIPELTHPFCAHTLSVLRHATFFLFLEKAACRLLCSFLSFSFKGLYKRSHTPQMVKPGSFWTDRLRVVCVISLGGRFSGGFSVAAPLLRSGGSASRS